MGKGEVLCLLFGGGGGGGRNYWMREDARVIGLQITHFKAFTIQKFLKLCKFLKNVSVHPELIFFPSEKVYPDFSCLFFKTVLPFTQGANPESTHHTPITVTATRYLPPCALHTVSFGPGKMKKSCALYWVYGSIRRTTQIVGVTKNYEKIDYCYLMIYNHI